MDLSDLDEKGVGPSTTPALPLPELKVTDQENNPDIISESDFFDQSIEILRAVVWHNALGFVSTGRVSLSL